MPMNHILLVGTGVEDGGADDSVLYGPLMVSISALTHLWVKISLGTSVGCVLAVAVVGHDGLVISRAR